MKQPFTVKSHCVTEITVGTTATTNKSVPITTTMTLIEFHTSIRACRQIALLLATVIGLCCDSGSSPGWAHGLTTGARDKPSHSVGRRHVLSTVANAALVLVVVDASNPRSVDAVDDANKKPPEFISVGQQAPPPDGSQPFITLENGVQVKDIKVGEGDAVTPNSKVDVQLNGRLLNLNGVIFYSTKKNNPGKSSISSNWLVPYGQTPDLTILSFCNGSNNFADGFGAIPLSLNLGKGTVVPGLEAGLVGMKKNGIRRIIVPQDLAYNKFPDLEPKPTSSIDQRALDSVVKNPRRDATILFDIQLERIKR